MLNFFFYVQHFLCMIMTSRQALFILLTLSQLYKHVKSHQQQQQYEIFNNITNEAKCMEGSAGSIFSSDIECIMNCQAKEKPNVLLNGTCFCTNEDCSSSSQESNDVIIGNSTFYKNTSKFHYSSEINLRN